MAVAPMLRVTALGHRSALDDVVDRLQHAGAIQIVQDDSLPQAAPVTDDRLRHDLEERMARVEFTVDFLFRFHESEAPLSTFVSEKVHLDEAAFRALEYDSDFDELYAECEQLSGRLADIARERERLTCLLHDLETWRELRLQIQRWRGTERVMLFAGTIGASRGPLVRQELRDAVTELSIEEVSAVGSRQAWVVMVIPEFEPEVRDILARTDFEEVSFSDLSDYPAEEIARAEQSLAEYGRDEEAALARAKVLAGEYHAAVALAEALRARWRGQTVREDFGTTERAFALRGWVPAKAVPGLEQSLAGISDVDLEFSEPGAEDSPPVMLDNPKWLQPFEVVTDLYGRPRYHDLDPTAALSLWFFFFFGLCLGDVGYGIALILVAWTIKTRLDIGESVKRFMDLLMYGGVASAIVGVFTGSYFAIEAEMLPEILQRFIVLDTVKDVQTLLIFSIAVGAVQILWGVLLKAYSLWRVGDTVGAVMDEVSTVLLWATVIAAVLLPQTGTVLLVGLGAVALLKGRVFVPPYGPRSLIGIATGVYKVYDTAIGHISDVLSYTRLAALGMASVLVGWVMNLVAGLFPKVWWGILAAVLVLVLGHSINLVISLLGAFVHPLRLQFVEFFSKFYEGGGENYAPFGYGTKSLVLRREATQEEGG